MSTELEQTGGTATTLSLEVTEPILQETPEVQAQSPATEVVPAQQKPFQISIDSMIDADLLASLDLPDPAEEESAQADTQQAPVETVPPVPVVEATPEPQALQPQTQSVQDGWPTLTPEPGKDAWGNIIQNGTPIIIVKENDGTMTAYEADPQTGLISFSDEELQQLRAVDPDSYINYITEKNNRLNRLSQTFQQHQQSEVETVQRQLINNGMPEQIIQKVHQRAEEMLKNYGSYQPGAYGSAMLGATSEILLYDPVMQVELARAIIAAHEKENGAVPQKAAPAPVAATPPANQRPVRLAAGGIASSSGTSPVVTNQPTNALQIPPDELRELQRLGLTADDYATFGAGVSI